MYSVVVVIEIALIMVMMINRIKFVTIIYLIEMLTLFEQSPVIFFCFE